MIKNLGELKCEVDKLHTEHGDNMMVVVATTADDGGIKDQLRIINLHFASDAIWIPVDKQSKIEEAERDKKC